jgi:uncharacterized protein GlcG (DUF336 family)
METFVAELTLSISQAIISEAISHARDLKLKPLAIVVLDARGAVKLAVSEDGTSLRRYEVAHGKAYGALALGTGSRSIRRRAKEQPHFIAAASHVIGGALVPVPGGVLLRSKEGLLFGAVGASGDTSDNDERVVLAGIQAAGLIGDPGTD